MMTPLRCAAHRGQHGLDGFDEAEHVHVELAAQHRHRRGLEGAVRAVAGVVE